MQITAARYYAMSKWGIPWTGYLVPARDGSGLLPDWESSWDLVVAAAVTWKFRLTFWLGNYIWSFQFGVWLIWELSEFWYWGSTQSFKPDWSSIVIWPGKPFLKKCDLVSISKNKMFIFRGTLEIRNFDKQSNIFKWPYLQLPPIQS